MTSDHRRSRLPEPLSGRLCAAAVLGFALWTLCCNLAVALGGSLIPLLAGFGGSAAIASLAWYCSRGSASIDPDPPGSTAAGGALAADRASRALHGAALFVGTLAVVSLHWHREPLIAWGSVLASLVVAAFACSRQRVPAAEQPAAGRTAELALWAIAIACVVVTLISHRPDRDDSFYLNLAVATADDPSRALLAGDTLHGIPDLPLYLSIYRIHAYELLIGAVSYLTGIPVIYCAHIGAAAVAALFVPLAHARLFRTLTPRHWLAALAVAMLILVSVGGYHLWYGNFAFVRIWQGKGILLFVFTPLVYAYALEFAHSGSRRAWLLLCAAQVAALGASATAIWLVPLSAGAAVLSQISLSRAGLRRLALGLLSSSYLLMVGLLLKGGVAGVFAPEASGAELGTPLYQALNDVLGESALRSFALGSVALAWAVCPPGAARRFAVAVPLIAVVTLLNPLAVELVTGELIGPYLWRGLWSLPIPILMTFVLIAPLQSIDAARRSSRARGLARLACLALVAVFVLVLPQSGGLSEANRVRLGWPGLKVPAYQYELASELNRGAGPGAYVVAPYSVGEWVPTFHDHAFPIMVRHYLTEQPGGLDREEILARSWMRDFVIATPGDESATQMFRAGLERFGVSGVCLRLHARTKTVIETLFELGFRMHSRADLHEIWVRDRPE